MAIAVTILNHKIPIISLVTITFCLCFSSPRIKTFLIITKITLIFFFFSQRQEDLVHSWAAVCHLTVSSCNLFLVPILLWMKYHTISTGRAPRESSGSHSKSSFTSYLAHGGSMRISLFIFRVITYSSLHLSSSFKYF